MIARDFIRLLAEKHSKDVFVPECKDGASLSREHVRLDAWACKRSYAHPLYTGYEVKCSRSDFTHDTKWRSYLPLCNQFYFVCPAGLIDKSELPAEAGLLWASVNGARLYVKKHAPSRTIDDPVGVFRYIVFSRATIARDMCDNASYWREWLEDKRTTQLIGRSASTKMRRLIAARISDVEKQNKELEARMATYDQVRHALTDLGILDDTGYRYDLANKARNKAIDMLKGIDSELLHSIKHAHERLGSLLAIVLDNKELTA